MDKVIPLHRPAIVGNEREYVTQVVQRGDLASDGFFTQHCAQLLEERLSAGRVLMTPSCTSALEMAARLCRLGPGDEVIMPSFTYVSAALAVVGSGARPVFVDIRPDTLNIDEGLIEAAITDRTRMILPVHYAGVASEMDRINEIAQRRRLLVVEDAALAIGAKYRSRGLGSLGSLGTLSFHFTKGISCGEGGALCINDTELVERAETMRDKGTNRSQFLRGQIDKYTWVDVGSSAVPNELACAFLLAQLESMDRIADRCRKICARYQHAFADLESRGVVQLPVCPDHCQPNHHMFYIVLPDRSTRDGLIQHLASHHIRAAFHYVPLHSSPMGTLCGYQRCDLPVTDDLSGRLLRLPVYYDLTPDEQDRIVAAVRKSF